MKNYPGLPIVHNSNLRCWFCFTKADTTTSVTGDEETPALQETADKSKPVAPSSVSLNFVRGLSLP